MVCLTVGLAYTLSFTRLIQTRNQGMSVECVRKLADHHESSSYFMWGPEGLIRYR
jgi:hypothetical protein